MIKHSLVLRLVMPLVLMAALVAGVLLLADHARRTVRVAQDAVTREDANVLALTELRSVSRSLQRDALNLVVEPDQRERASIRDRFDRRVGQFRQDLRMLPAATVTSGEELGAYRTTQAHVLESLLDVRGAADADRARALEIFRHAVRPAERAASSIADDMIERSLARDHALRGEALVVEHREMRLALLLSIALAIVVIAAGVTMIVLTVVRPLGDIRLAMETLAGGDAGLIVPHARRRDAIGRMARAIEVFRLATCERDVLRASDEERRHAEIEQDRSAAETRRRVEAEATQQIALERQRRSLLLELAAAVDQSLSSVNEKLRGSAERLSRSADDVTRHAAAADREASETEQAAAAVTIELAATGAATRQMADGVAGLRTLAEEAVEAVRAAIAQSRGAALRVAGLVNYADSVAETMQLIKTVSRQSRMLALNATIEASRAGGAGRGFAVVASEMKSLAQQTAGAAERVEAEVATIRSVAADGSAAIGEMEEAVVLIEHNAAVLLRTMTEQGLLNAEIGRSVETALSGVDRVSARMSDLGRTARGTHEVAGALHADAGLLSSDASRVDTALRELVNQLKVA
jgi:methyl-accepting chemotaxis protein